MAFPTTKYMGSKQAILPFIMQQVVNLEYETVLDAFSGSGCVSYAFKQMGKRVVANDFLKFSFHLARATVQNNSTILARDEVNSLLRYNKSAPTFIREKFSDLYFSEEDCAFLDNTYANSQLIKGHIKRSLVLSALCRACMKKRPRGIFTFVGHKGWDGRQDLRLSMKEQFINAVAVFNNAVFTNRKANKAFCMDTFQLPTEGIDLVYIDPPYISHHSDCDYTRRYHFLEGLCTYWHDIDIQEDTITKKFKSYPTLFSRKSDAANAFARLFEKFAECKIVVSYGSNGIPSKDEIIDLLKAQKSKVTVASINHTYSFGNHGHLVNNNNNHVHEYLFIAE